MSGPARQGRASNPKRVRVVIFDVRKTLSEMGPLADSFGRVGLNPAFAEVASEVLRVRLTADDVAEADVGSAVEDVMATFGALRVHPDVAAGVRALRDLGVRLVPLSDGSTGLAQGLLERAGLRDDLERLLSVEDASGWKPHPDSYAYALSLSGVTPGEAMLVAVHPWDTDGAGRAGPRTGWLNRHQARYPSYFTAPEIEAPDLLELANALR